MENELARNQRFLLKVEQTIRLSNKEVIHKLVQPINTERMLSFAVAVAKLRAQYIEAAFNFTDVGTSKNNNSTVEIEELSLCRRQFEEARDAFIALQRAIELGYVDIE